MSMTPLDRVERIYANAVGSDLNSWEKHQFLPKIRNQKSLTVDQEKVLVQIEDKLGLLESE